MATLKGTEKFVAEKLQSYFSAGNCSVDFEEGDDPPDIYLLINGKKVSVEITDIDQNVLRNRKTIDYGYLRFIVDLDKELGSLITGDKKLNLTFYHSYEKVSAISKKFKKYLKSIIEEDKAEIGATIEHSINGVDFEISAFKMPNNGGRKIVGGVMPDGSKVQKSRDVDSVGATLFDADLTAQTLAIVQERISNKNAKCEGVQKPVWLAFYDNYYRIFTSFDDSEHLKHYSEVFKMVESFGRFERILVVFENGDVFEPNR